ncbi:MAG: efflux RND transporter periplasmic adaptor subunit [Bryobacteraceae bacterium]|nr:efflux RND transporter periplasmic adaptor subunit [Bryobacteraceae bacterium]
MHTQITAVVIAAGLLVMSGCGQGKAESTRVAPVPVQTASVEEVAVKNTTEYSATIEPDTTVEMAFKVDGYVDSLLQVGGRKLQEGDFVAKGSVLARVRQSDYRASLDVSRAQALQAAEGLNAAAWQLSQVEAIHKKASLDADRAEALYKEKALTKPDYDAARAQLDSTRAQVEAARKNVEALRNSVESAKAQERLAGITFADTALVAPMPAVVLEKKVEPGSLVGRGTPVFRLGDLTTVRMAFGVPDTLLVGLKLGAPIAVHIDALPDLPLQGRIRQIGAAADPATRLFRVEVAIPNEKRQLRVGMMGKVSVPDNSGSAPLPAVPAAALLRSPSDPNAAAVFVMEGGPGQAVARLRSVRLGQFAGSRVVVAAGLNPGERVVTGGRQNLVDGAAIRVVQ